MPRHNNSQTPQPDPVTEPLVEPTEPLEVDDTQPADLDETQPASDDLFADLDADDLDEETTPPADGEVNPEPDTDEEVAVIRAEVDALRDEAATRNQENENRTVDFSRRPNAINLNEIILNRTGEAIGIEPGFGTYRIYPQAYDTLSAYELDALDQFEEGRERVSGR